MYAALWVTTLQSKQITLRDRVDSIAVHPVQKEIARVMQKIVRPEPVILYQ